MDASPIRPSRNVNTGFSGLPRVVVGRAVARHDREVRLAAERVVQRAEQVAGTCSWSDQASSSQRWATSLSARPRMRPWRR